MKNLSLALNVVLLIAVGILYYLHFSGPSATQKGGVASYGDVKVAYISSDSLLKNYEYFKVSADRLDAKGKRLDQDLKNRAQALQNEFESYQRSQGNMTIGQARAVEEDLTKKRQNLQLYQESLNQEMMVDQNKMREELYTKLTTFLKKYGKENGLQLVLRYDGASDVLYGLDSLDISADVIKGLNESYKAEQQAVKTDSVSAKKK